MVPYQQLAAGILDQWRAVERRLAEPGLDPDLAEELQAEVTRLRDEYQRLVLEARQAQRPEPPPFPAPAI